MTRPCRISAGSAWIRSLRSVCIRDGRVVTTTVLTVAVFALAGCGSSSGSQKNLVAAFNKCIDDASPLLSASEQPVANGATDPVVDQLHGVVGNVDLYASHVAAVDNASVMTGFPTRIVRGVYLVEVNRDAPARDALAIRACADQIPASSSPLWQVGAWYTASTANCTQLDHDGVIAGHDDPGLDLYFAHTFGPPPEQEGQGWVWSAELANDCAQSGLQTVPGTDNLDALAEGDVKRGSALSSSAGTSGSTGTSGNSGASSSAGTVVGAPSPAGASGTTQATATSASSGPAPPAGSSGAITGASSTTAASSSATSTGPSLTGQFNLSPPTPRPAHYVTGIAKFVSDGAGTAIVIGAGPGLEPSTPGKTAYGFWLTNRTGDLFLGFTTNQVTRVCLPNHPDLCENGVLSAKGLLPAIATPRWRYSKLLVTLETVRNPTAPAKLVGPGQIVLEGAVRLPG